ncbi:MAG: hypothetical protein IJX62_04715 [Clostridia bacterium]|nr:hypothetical protein [Clostridia bacterium]
MKPYQTFAAWLQRGCVYFTLLALLMLFINIAISGGEATNYVKTGPFLLLFPCGLGIALADLLRKAKSIPGPWQRILHFAVTTLSLILFLWLPTNPGARASTALILLAAYSLLYWIICLLIHLTVARVRRLLDED